MLKMIEHVQLAMPTGKEEIARQFYTGILGLAEVPKPENLARRGGCWFSNGSVKVHLGIMDDFRPATKAHPAFIVENLDALRARLEAANVTCTDDEPLEGFARTYIFDPFGNRIELMERLYS